MVLVLSRGGVGAGGPGQSQRGVGAARHRHGGCPGPGPQGRAAAIRTTQGEHPKTLNSKNPAHGPGETRPSNTPGGSKVAFTRSLDPAFSTSKASDRSFLVCFFVSCLTVSDSTFLPLVHLCATELLLLRGSDSVTKPGSAVMGQCDRQRG